MIVSIFDKMPLREKDLSHFAVYGLRISSILFILSALILTTLQAFHPELLERIGIGRFIVQGILGVSSIFFALNRLTSRLAFPQETLDEWEQSLKSEMSNIGYSTACILALLSCIVTVLLYNFQVDFTLHAEQLTFLSLNFMIAMFIFPIAVIAWRIKPLSSRN